MLLLLSVQQAEDSFLEPGKFAGEGTPFNPNTGALVKRFDFAGTRSPVLYEKNFILGTPEGHLIKLDQFFNVIQDEKIIDGLGPNGAALVTHLAAGRTSRLQTGYLYHYAFAMLLGFLIIVSWVVFK